jgi:hypothetical protein
MSDTSIGYRSSYDNDPDNDPHKKGNCWTRIGANVCVGVLLLLTIILSIALIYIFYQKYQMENSYKVKTQGKGGKSKWPIAGDIVKGFHVGSSDDEEPYDNSDGFDE